MQDAYMNLESLLGFEKTERLAKAKIAIFGLGSAGSYVAEGLARCGVGSLTLIDHSEIKNDEINRNCLARRSTVGKTKVQAAKEQIASIDADILVHTYETYYSEDTAAMFDLKGFDYIVDTLGDVDAKLTLIRTARENHIPILSCMETANKLNPSRFEITDISRTSVCPMAKVIRTSLRKKGIHKVKVLFSKERGSKNPDRTGTIVFAPAIAGMMIVREVVRDLLIDKKK